MSLGNIRSSISSTIRDGLIFFKSHVSTKSNLGIQSILVRLILWMKP